MSKAAPARRRLRHALRLSPGAISAAFVEIGNKVAVSTLAKPRPGNTVVKDAAFQIYAKRLADEGFARVVGALEMLALCVGREWLARLMSTASAPISMRCCTRL